MPWIGRFTEGVVNLDKCAACGAPNYFPRGDMRARLWEENGTQWPDLIGNGDLVGLFVSSGRFVEALRSCGARSGDVRATKVTQYTFDYDAASGLDLFTTDMSPRAFFCTERVLECAREHRLTNVAITRVEDGPDAKPIKYW